MTTILDTADKELVLHSRKFYLMVLLKRSCQGTQTPSIPIPCQSGGLSTDAECIPGSSSPSGLRFSAAFSVLSWSAASSPSWTGEGLWSFSSSSREGQERCLHRLLSTCPYLKRYARLTHSPGARERGCLGSQDAILMLFSSGGALLPSVRAIQAPAQERGCRAAAPSPHCPSSTCHRSASAMSRVPPPLCFGKTEGGRARRE